VIIYFWQKTFEIYHSYKIDAGNVLD